jgi:thioredoxin-like negative regulator of GroEL
MERKHLVYLLLAVGAIGLVTYLWKCRSSSDNGANIASEIDKMDPQRPNFVLYYADWCGYSRQFLPIWDKFVSQVAASGKQVDTPKLNCIDKDADVCKAYGVEGYPTMILYHRGKEIPYTGSRTVKALHAFLEQHC